MIHLQSLNWLGEKRTDNTRRWWIVMKETTAHPRIRKQEEMLALSKTGLAISELSKSVPEVLIYLSTVPELTLKAP